MEQKLDYGRIGEKAAEFDFQQELLWNGEDMEMLEPEWLRKEIAGKIQRIWNKYKG